MRRRIRRELGNVRERKKLEAIPLAVTIHSLIVEKSHGLPLLMNNTLLAFI